MTKTPHLAIPLLVPNQAQKEITINEALLLIEVLLVGVVKEIYLNHPPADEASAQDIYIIGENPRDIWHDKANHIAYFFQGWRYCAPKEGMSMFVLKQAASYRFINNVWYKL
jgi:Protein of unknown function (DUF2793)